MIQQGKINMTKLVFSNSRDRSKNDFSSKLESLKSTLVETKNWFSNIESNLFGAPYIIGGRHGSRFRIEPADKSEYKTRDSNVSR